MTSWEYREDRKDWYFHKYISMQYPLITGGERPFRNYTATLTPPPRIKMALVVVDKSKSPVDIESKLLYHNYETSTELIEC